MASEKSSTSGMGGKILKGIGVATAVISLVLGTRQIVNMLQDNAARREKAAEFKSAALQFASSGLYSKAWETISQPAEADPSLRNVQVDLAMQWLRRVRITANQKEQSFTEIVNKLLPVLYRAVDTTNRSHAATVKAHIGWGYYLMFREGDRSADVDGQFLDALRLDTANVYANVMYGFWLIYPGHGTGDLPGANRHFAIARRSGEDKEFVRDLIFSAYRNVPRPEYAAQLIRAANEMRQANEMIPLALREGIVGDVYFMSRREIMDEVAKLMPLPEHRATFLYLTNGMDLNAKPYLKEALAKLNVATE